MDAVWAGRQLLQAAPALQSRYLEAVAEPGPGARCLGPVVGDLLRQVGLFLLVGETDYRRPFARTRGVLRFDPDLLPHDLARAFNALMALTASYLDHLPGVPAATRALARQALRHAAAEALVLLQSMRTGERPAGLSGFGGAPLLAFPARRSVVVSGTRTTR